MSSVEPCKQDQVRDNETWLRQLSGDGTEQDAALGELRDALLRALYRSKSTRFHVDESLLEDAVQETLIIVLQQLNRFEGRSRFLTWATSIAIHVTMSKLRRKQWKDVRLDDVINNSDAAYAASLSIDDAAENHRDQITILNTMHSLIQEKLTDRQRTVLLAELRGMPLCEIARQLGSNPNAVYKVGHDARKRLKNALESAGFQASDITAAFTR